MMGTMGMMGMVGMVGVVEFSAVININVELYLIT